MKTGDLNLKSASLRSQGPCFQQTSAQPCPVLDSSVQTKTDPNGHYRVTHVPAGVYDVTLRVDGAEAERRSGVTIHEDTTTDLNFDLVNNIPNISVSGVVSYPVVHNVVVGQKASSEQTQGIFAVTGLTVTYSDTRSGAYSFTLPCGDFLGHDADLTAKGLTVAGRYFDDHFSDKRVSPVVFRSRKEVFEGISRECRTAVSLDFDRQTAEANKRREDDAKARQAYEAFEAQTRANKEIELRNDIVKAWRATSDREAFETIRGDYDLDSTDSRHWKSSLVLPWANECFLVRTDGNGLQFWTFVCQFRPSDGFGSYQQIIQAVQSSLNISYRPDETAANVNQVYFSDPAKPLWRLVVTKLAEPSGNVLLWITPQQQVNGSAATPFNPAAPSSDTTIRAEIEKIRTGKYTSLPPIQRTGATTSRNGMAVFEVKNDTAYALTALFSGPIERRVEVAPGSSVSVELPPGAYKLVGRVNALDVLPSYGEHTFDQSSSGLRFFLQ